MIACLLFLLTVCAATMAAIFGAEPLWVVGVVALVAVLGWAVLALTEAARTYRSRPLPTMPPAPPQLPPTDTQYGTAWARRVPPHRHRRPR
ncbi:hypothetical protein AB0903_09200 [Streptomyces sp. NPDC048389]|uniref:hypothetical protein n=1 Tax=Streptomyces sp. NPDC048389 TaxID=3154622 RepID=UPI0034550854